MPQAPPENVQLPKHLLEEEADVLLTGEGGTAGRMAWAHLNGAVEEAAVLSWLVDQAFGQGQGHHAPRLVGLLQAFSRFLEHLNPCFGACSWFQGKNLHL